MVGLHHRRDIIPACLHRCGYSLSVLTPNSGTRLLLRGYRVHTLLCRSTGVPLLSLLSPANVHDAPFARPMLDWAVRLYDLRPRIVRLDAGCWAYA